MKKGRILRLMFILAVTTIMIAATAVVASAATVNKNDADYKITTYPNKFNINSINVSAADSGRTSRLEVVGVNKNFATIINGWNDGKCIKAKGMKPKKKYTFKFYGKLKVDNPALDAPDGITVEEIRRYSKMLKWDLQ